MDDLRDTDSALADGGRLLRGKRVRLRATSDADIDALVGWRRS